MTDPLHSFPFKTSFPHFLLHSLSFFLALFLFWEMLLGRHHSIKLETCQSDRHWKIWNSHHFPAYDSYLGSQAVSVLSLYWLLPNRAPERLHQFTSSAAVHVGPQVPHVLGNTDIVKLETFSLIWCEIVRKIISIINSEIEHLPDKCQSIRFACMWNDYSYFQSILLLGSVLLLFCSIFVYLMNLASLY